MQKNKDIDMKNIFWSMNIFVILLFILLNVLLLA